MINYEPAPLKDGQISKLREYEQQLSQLTGNSVILVAYSEKDDNAPSSEGQVGSTEKKRP